MLWTNYKGFHWETVGPRFHELHEQFGEWADEVYGTIDDLAERLRWVVLAASDELVRAAR